MLSPKEHPGRYKRVKALIVFILLQEGLLSFIQHPLGRIEDSVLILNCSLKMTQSRYGKNEP